MYNNVPKWYIEYDYKTFHILQDPKFNTLIFKAMDNFEQIQGPQFQEKDQETEVPPWISEIAESLKEMTTELHHFFYVQCFMPKNSEKMKSRLRKICSVLRVEIEYCKYFLTMSVEFRINRILASALRIKRFMECIVEFMNDFKREMDEKLLDNLSEVDCYLKQKILETLEVTKSQGDHQLNIILFDILFVLLRNSGEITLMAILNNNQEKQIMDNILKLNEISNDFIMQKLEEKRKFDEHTTMVFDCPIEEDPNEKKEVHDEN